MTTEDNKPSVQDQERLEVFNTITNLENEQTAAKNAVWFIAGLVVFGIGLFLVFQNTVLYTSFSLLDLIGFNPPFGIVLLPLIIGVGILFFNEKSVIGWVLVIIGLTTIILGIIMGLKIFFKPVTLYEGLLMFCTISAGVGMMAKAIAGRK